MNLAVSLPFSVAGARREFHIRRDARRRYDFDDSIFSLQGHVVLANAGAARNLAHRVNRVRGASTHPDQALSAADVYAMGLLDEILHFVIGRYRKEYGDKPFRELREQLESAPPAGSFARTLERFAASFPTVEVYRDEASVQASLDRVVDGVSGVDVAVEEMILLRLDNDNPAYSPGRELFSDRELVLETTYPQVTDQVERFFETQPPFGPEQLPLIELLRLPAKLFPNSLQDQLRYIRDRWSSLIGGYFDRLLRGLDLIAEETKMRSLGPGPAAELTFGGVYDDGEPDVARFSPDRHWMPEVVLIAKSTLVWLDQLSRWYGRDIRTLDAIPDEELDRIALRGFTGLWLIGLWERSQASKRIKRSMGNLEAEASAYSIYDYDIAGELGGWSAVENLRHRLRQRGVRLASDMVPNHVAIDGRWVYEHPEWFVQVDHPPFPGYSFSGENLSSRDGIVIQLEDHYYDKSDAAVVFRVWDDYARRERFVYHGNDGTSMPWNDTAQINYLNAEAREAIIQTILHVARNFPIIRFDAAMTLAKKHIRRLWFPAPGHGGDIPSRSDHGLSDEDFHRAIPIEFWREVVDRVAAEAPDTLLLAEAFWMMEGYFVRTLGMHRVYNSAFMNMLKNEENAKYRATIRNTLEYDPEVLKRFVNFMNNPDEETAIAQFGRDDKYFGVATVMVTMPGLPMFGHGQVEGFEEKYGMEYRHAYRDETPDAHLIERHEREVFPLMRRRYLFAESRDFRLYDFFDTDGNVNENVYAYSNRAGDERSLVFFNNSYYETAGWILGSVPFAVGAESDAREIRLDRLGSALAIPSDYSAYLVFREQRSNLWFIRNCGEIHERGLFVMLRGYDCQVFLDMRYVYDSDHAHYARLADQLNGGGVPDVDTALRRLMLQPLHDAFAVVANSGRLRRIEAALFPGETPAEEPVDMDWTSFVDEYTGFMNIASTFSSRAISEKRGRRSLERLVDAFTRLCRGARSIAGKGTALRAHLEGRAEDSSIVLALLLLLPLQEAMTDRERETPVGFGALDQIGEWFLVHELRRVFEQMRTDGHLPENWDLLVSILIHHAAWNEAGTGPATVVERLLEDPNVHAFLHVHEWDGTVWFNREAFEELTDWLLVVGLWQEYTGAKRGIVARRDEVLAHCRTIKDAGERSGYQIEPLLSALAAE